MKKILLLALAVGGLMIVEARPNGPTGYRRGRMDWSHLGPRPEAAASAKTTKQGSRADTICHNSGAWSHGCLTAVI